MRMNATWFQGVPPARPNATRPDRLRTDQGPERGPVPSLHTAHLQPQRLASSLCFVIGDGQRRDGQAPACARERRPPHHVVRRLGGVPSPRGRPRRSHRRLPAGPLQAHGPWALRPQSSHSIPRTHRPAPGCACVRVCRGACTRQGACTRSRSTRAGRSTSTESSSRSSKRTVRGERGLLEHPRGRCWSTQEGAAGAPKRALLEHPRWRCLSTQEGAAGAPKRALLEHPRGRCLSTQEGAA